MCRQNHNCAVDYFALGVIGYEFMLGRVLKIILLIIDYRGPITVKLEKTLEIKFSLNRYQLRSMRFLKAGLLKLQTLSIKYKLYHS
jgi:hypothetical protein